MSETTVIPTALRVHLAHAAVQAVAELAEADLLHLKGPALHAALRPTTPWSGPAGEATVRPAPRLSTDADVLCRPAHVDAFMRELTKHGWRIVARFDTGSAFEHAASLWHTELGYVDVHRRFPGIGDDAGTAFDRLWSGRGIKEIAHVDCAVPALGAQRLILLLHAARGGGLNTLDAAFAWTKATETERQQTLALAAEYRAEVALAAATGRLDEYAHDPSADLWRIFAEGGSPTRLDEWRARFKAASGFRGKARVVAKAFVVNTDHLEMELLRPPTRREVAGAYVERSVAGVRESTALVRRGLASLAKRVGR